MSEEAGQNREMYCGTLGKVPDCVIPSKNEIVDRKAEKGRGGQKG